MLNIKKFAKMLKNNNMVFDLDDNTISAGYTSPDNNDFDFSCTCDETTLAFFVYGPNLQGDEDRIKEKLVEACKRYRYWKFYMDENRDLHMHFQTPLCYVEDPKIFLTMLESAGVIIDDLMPQLALLADF